MTTKTAFLEEYRRRLAMLPWAADPDKLTRFMASVETTITTERAPWNHDSDLARQAFRAIGCKGAYTRKALRALT